MLPAAGEEFGFGAWLGTSLRFRTPVRFGWLDVLDVALLRLRRGAWLAGLHESSLLGLDGILNDELDGRRLLRRRALVRFGRRKQSSVLDFDGVCRAFYAW